MPRKGEVRVLTSLANIREALMWLQAIRRMWLDSRATLLGPKADALVSRTRVLQSLSDRLHKAVNRRRVAGKTDLKVHIPRGEAKAFLALYEGALVRSKPGATKFWRYLGLQRDLKEALHGPGRRRLSDQQRRDRLSGAINVVGRQKKRIQRTEKDEVRFRAWSRDLRRRGETLLTHTTGPPKI
jgi:hypothetical protein